MNKYCKLLIIYLVLCSSTILAEEGIVAIVNNDAITQKELNDFISFMKIQMSGQHSEEEIEQKINDTFQELINRLIEDKLILQAAYKEGIVINKARIDARIEQIRKGYRNESDFQSALIAQGLTLADIESKIKEQALMYEIIDRKVKSSITVIPHEITAYYNEHIADFVKPERRQVRYLIIKEPTLIEQIKNKISEYKNLDAIANDNSLKIADFGWINSNQLRKEIADVVFGLEIGKLTTYVEQDNSLYIFEVMAVEPEGCNSLSEVQDRIYGLLFESKMQERLVKWLEELKSRAYIKIKN